MTHVLLAPPFLSIFDPNVEAEGSIDPLGLQRTYEQLAERILPFLTVRMARPRFLTAMSVGSLVCARYRDEIAADGVTPPWLVFEWIVLEGFMRRGDRVWIDQPHSVPGIQKTRRALERGQRLSHSSYLKTAKIFGFTGVYRRLAHGLEILTDDLDLDEGGWVLLRHWERERNLEGFATGSGGAGARLREELAKAVARAMKKGHVVEYPNWPIWEDLARHFDPAGAGPSERRVILERILSPELHQNRDDLDACRMRGEFFERLIEYGKYVDREEEATFFRSMMKKAGRELRKRLEAIDAYEALCRPLDDGFQLLLHLSSERGPGPIDVDDYSRDHDAKALAARVGPTARRVAAVLEDGFATPESRRLVERFEQVRDAGGLFENLIEHHEEIQREKPPDGKRPWLERLRGVVVRPQYMRRFRPDGGDTYVHWYRTGTVATFLQDLGKLPR